MPSPNASDVTRMYKSYRGLTRLLGPPSADATKATTTRYVIAVGRMSRSCTRSPLTLILTLLLNHMIGPSKAHILDCSAPQRFFFWFCFLVIVLGGVC